MESTTSEIHSDVIDFLLKVHENIVDSRLKLEVGLFLFACGELKHNKYKTAVVQLGYNILKSAYSNLSATGYQATETHQLFSTLNSVLAVAHGTKDSILISEGYNQVHCWIIESFSDSSKLKLSVIRNGFLLLIENARWSKKHIKQDSLEASLFSYTGDLLVHDMWKAKNLCEIGTKFVVKLSPSKQKAWYNLLGEILEHITIKDSKRSKLAASSHAQHAISAYKKAQNEEGIKRAENLYSELRSEGEYGRIVEELDKDSMSIIQQQINRIVNKSTHSELLYHLAGNSILADYATIRREAEDQLNEHIHLKLFGQTVIDELGNTVAHYRSEEEKLEYAFFSNSRLRMQIALQMIGEIFKQSLTKRKLSFRQTMHCLRSGWLGGNYKVKTSTSIITVYPIRWLRPGFQVLASELTKYLKNPNYPPKWNLVVDSLTPKVEGTLRLLLQLNGASTFKQTEKNKVKVMVEKNLDDILHDIGSQGFLAKDDIVFLKFSMTGRIGYNLRNRVAHALIFLNQFGFDQVLLSLECIIRISNYKLVSQQ